MNRALMLAIPCAAAAFSASADVVIDWNNALLQAIRETGGGPCPISRKAAIVHVAIYDAVNSILRTHEQYGAIMDCPPGTSIEAAAAVAAHDAMAALYPGLQTVDIGALLAKHLGTIPDGPSKEDGRLVGEKCALSTLQMRANDGSDDDTPYVLGREVGSWAPTSPNPAPPHAPNWPQVTPWCMLSGDQFRPPGPAGYTSMTALLNSPEYVLQYNEVKELGALNSATRTEYETETAIFWANDRDGTYKPPGHLFYITQVISADHGLTMPENARLFARLAIAMAEAGIAAWDSKYATDIDLWRPVSGIRAGDFDGNPFTVGDPNWESLSFGLPPGYTPPFPAWVSGHATFGAAHAAVVRNWFHTDAITFTVTSDDTPGVFRTYHSLEAAARENGRSRILLGVHWQWDADDGYDIGTNVDDWVSTHVLRRLGDLNGDDVVDGADLGELLAAWDASGGEADLNFDGLVDGADLGILLANFG